MLSPEQTRAYDAFFSWTQNQDKSFWYLSGAAGVGKTFWASQVASSWQGPVAPMAFTGKAALVLTKKGLPATTIHKKLYLPANERTEEVEALRWQLEQTTDPKEHRRISKRLEALNAPSFVLRPNSPFLPGTLIILDECSMVTESLANDLMSFGCPILVLGDRNQLPPIEGAGYFTKTPDFELTEIHRQALESPVIRLANLAREGRPLPLGAYGASLVTTRKKITSDLALSCSQIICGSNKARKELNVDMRRFQNFTSPLPQKGERLICLRNNPRDNLLNGQMIDLAEDVNDSALDTMRILSTEGHNVEAFEACFSDPDSIKTWSYQKRKRANEFDWAWAVTAHKAQGSEWESVLVWADQFRWDKDMFKKWLYTACTRASDRLVIAL